MTDMEYKPDLKVAKALADMAGMDKRLQNHLETLLERAPALMREIQPYGEDPSRLSTRQLTKLVVWTVRLNDSFRIGVGDLAAEYMVPWLKLLSQTGEKAQEHPFFAARDAQLEASPARHLVEQHLNSLSQGGIEQLAEALQQGGQLRVVVRK